MIQTLLLISFIVLVLYIVGVHSDKQGFKY